MRQAVRIMPQGAAQARLVSGKQVIMVMHARLGPGFFLFGHIYPHITTFSLKSAEIGVLLCLA